MTTPTRVTIIPQDTFCAVDGVGYTGIAMTSVAPNVHAMQWYATHGEVEIKDPATGKILYNNKITHLDDYLTVLDAYWEIRQAAEAFEAAQQLADQVVKV
jgi:hypothetical protein